MAITYNISLVGNASATGTANVVITLPGGIAQNDVVYAWGCSSQTTNADCVESGGTYTELADLYQNDSTDVNSGLYRKVQGATPDSSVTIDAGGTAHAGVAVTLRGVDTGTPEDAATTTTGAINGGTPNPLSITTVTPDAWVLPFAGSSEADAVSNPPTNYADLVDIQSTAINAMASRRTIVAPGAEDPGTYADIVGTGADSWTAATVAARPALAPFTEFNWPRPADRPRNIASLEPQGYNRALLTPVENPRIFRAPLFARIPAINSQRPQPDINLLPLQTFVAPEAAPFGLYDWPAAARGKPAWPDTLTVNLLPLIATALPGQQAATAATRSPGVVAGTGVSSFLPLITPLLSLPAGDQASTAATPPRPVAAATTVSSFLPLIAPLLSLPHGEQESATAATPRPVAAGTAIGGFLPLISPLLSLPLGNQSSSAATSQQRVQAADAAVNLLPIQTPAESELPFQTPEWPLPSRSTSQQVTADVNLLPLHTNPPAITTLLPGQQSTLGATPPLPAQSATMFRPPAAPTPLPFLIVDWPATPPRPKAQTTDIVNRLAGLFPAPPPIAQFDWPAPAIPLPGAEQTLYSNILLFPPPVQPPPTILWENPRRPQHPVSLMTFINAANPATIPPPPVVTVRNLMLTGVGV